MKRKILFAILIVSILITITGVFLFYKFLFAPPKINPINQEISENDKFRNGVVKFIREVAENYFENTLTSYPEDLNIKGDWDAEITIYYQGAIMGRGEGKNPILSPALETATRNVLEDNKRFKIISKGDLSETIFIVNLKNISFSIIDSGGEGKEIIGDLAIIRSLDKELVKEKIEEGKKYLFRIMDKELYGFHKYYDAINDGLENQLHTIYSASSIYTLLYIYEFTGDAEILKNLNNFGNFLLLMQNKDENSVGYGAFHYSYDLGTKKKELNFVVGTSAKTIFTLLRLYDLTKDSKYLESAKLAGDWLLTMQKSDGLMNGYVKYKESDKQWVYSAKESFLYNGQVLSAFSRLYNFTRDEKYYLAAQNLAKNFTARVEKEGCYLGDDYRSKNPISSSWVVLSLLDFYKTKNQDYYKSIVLKCSQDLLKRQITDENDVVNNGRWDNSFSSSGTGWINEVMVEVYNFFCKEGNKINLADFNCDESKKAIVRATRWLIQNTYSLENTFFLKNPQNAIGGLFWDPKNKYIRTDSVCHGLNGYLRIINDLGDDVLISLPEKTLGEILSGR